MDPIPTWALIAGQAERLTPRGSTAAPFPTLAPPLTMVMNGERKTLVVCVVNDLSQDTADAIWFSNENGSALDSFTYGVSREEDGTFSTVSHLSVLTAELETWESLACHVRQNRTAQVREMNKSVVATTLAPIFYPSCRIWVLGVRRLSKAQRGVRHLTPMENQCELGSYLPALVCALENHLRICLAQCVTSTTKCIYVAFALPNF
uniref:Ig-like domain-containing protein n=1 Tax=Chelydra serpentina TaxID=8475 RepID=A0A8C3RZ46_CHESE